MTDIKRTMRELTAAALLEKCGSCGAEPGTPCDVKSKIRNNVEIHVVRAIQAVDRGEQ